MRRVYISRFGAFGDQTHASHIPRIFKEEGYHVTFEYNYKGAQLLALNPFIDKHIFFEPPQSWIENHQSTLIERYHKVKALKNLYDRVVDLSGSLEGALIPGEAEPDYYRFKKYKSKHFSNICFYDQTVKRCFLPEKYFGRVGEIYFKKAEHDRVIDWYKPIEDKFVIIWALAGSMQQKAIYPWVRPVIDEFHANHPDTIFLLTAGPEHKDKAWENEYTINLVGKMPFRQIALMTKYANAVVTPETGLGIIAGSYGTPKMMLLTAASLKNIVGNDKNDFSLQSQAWCSPCQRAIYNTDYCQTKDGHPICVYFPKDIILRKLEEMYQYDYIPNREKRDELIYV